MSLSSAAGLWASPPLITCAQPAIGYASSKCHATVAQGATYGHGGTVLPTPLDVWFGPTFMASRQNAKTAS
ncbi:MAG: D-amino acid dehydrogenase (EC [uncultured Paraburkholderia sp.]|nr:MAG: D-amino acid dehydrogenase (EC [uncultured Paraburkholderia sp.]